MVVRKSPSRKSLLAETIRNDIKGYHRRAQWIRELDKYEEKRLVEKYHCDPASIEDEERERERLKWSEPDHW